MPNDLPTILEISRREFATLLPRFCDKPGDRSCGGFIDANIGYADSRNSIYDAQSLFSAYVYPDFPETYGNPELLEKIRLHLAFMQRRQYPDGTIALEAGGAGGSNEVGFTIPLVYESYRRVERSALPGRDEILAVLSEYIRRGAIALRRGIPYTSNHRWTAHIGPLAAAHQLHPDPADAAQIEEFLSDGIEMDKDGLYYEERSPNYNNVGNFGLYYLADYWGRRDLLPLIERNLWFTLAMQQPSGETETIFSHRQDRGARGGEWRSYALFKRMAVETGNGVFASVADEILPHADQRCPGPIRYLFDDPRMIEDNIPREPIPDRTEIRFSPTPIYRYRNRRVATTVVADPGGHFWDITQGTWGGKQRADAFMDLHCGEAIIDAVKIRWGTGVGGFRPEEIVYTGETSMRLTYRDPGWGHVAHFRPPEKWGPRHVDGLQEAEVNIGRDADDAFRLQIEVGGWPDMPLNIHFLMREGCRLQTPDGSELPLVQSGRTFTPAAGEYALIGPDGSRIVFSSLPRSEHCLYIGDGRTLTGQAESKAHRLILALFAPVKLDLRLLTQPAA